MPTSLLSKAKSSVALQKPRVFDGHSAILGISHWAPESVQTAKELEQLITTGVSGLELEKRLGMVEKRVARPEESLADMSSFAIERLIDNKTFDNDPIDLDEIDAVIYFGIVTELVEPATALVLANRFGIRTAFGFDVSDACMGFSDAWMIADSMIAAGQIRNALLVGAEKSTLFSNRAIEEINNGAPLRDHYAALSLGDGASAALIGPRESANRCVNLVAGCRESYSEFVDLCQISAIDKPMITQSGKLIESATIKFPPLLFAVLEHTQWDLDELSFYVAHQASLPGIQNASRMMGVPFEKSRNTIQQFGNMAAVAIPFTLSKTLAEQQEWHKQQIMQLAFGSGLAVGVFALETS